MSVIHFHNILLARPACFAAHERGLALTVVPANVTCPGCIAYLRGGTRSELLEARAPAEDGSTASGV